MEVSCVSNDSPVAVLMSEQPSHSSAHSSVPVKEKIPDGAETSINVAVSMDTVAKTGKEKGTMSVPASNEYSNTDKAMHL